MDDWDFSSLWDSLPSITPDYSQYWRDALTSDLFGGTAGTAADAAAATTGGDTSWFSGILDALKTPGVLPAIQSGAGLLTAALGGNAQTGAINKALSQLQGAYGMASSTAQDQYNKALAMQQPYRELGASILPTYGAYAAGLSPGRSTLQNMADSGLYNWQAEQLNRQINNQLSARGRYDSGAGLKTLADAQRALAAQEAEKKFGRQLTLENMDYGRLLDAANMGMGAAAGGAGLAQNQGQNLANLYTGLGQSQAQGSTALGNATASMYGGANKAIQGGLGNLYAQMGF